MGTVVSSFESSLQDLDVEVVRADVEAAPSVLDGLLQAPVVGTSLSAVGISLNELVTDVVTDPTQEQLFEARYGLTPAVYGIADYGSVVLQGTVDGEEPLSLYPERHVAVLARSDIHEGMAGALDSIAGDIRDGNRSHIIATGPSATADMGELVEGAHGPKAVEVVVVTDR